MSALCSVFVKGYAAGAHYNHGGSGSNFLCLPEDPQWGIHIAGLHSLKHEGRVYGVEYELWRNAGTSTNNVFDWGSNELTSRGAPCALCYVENRSTVVMMPARTQCPTGWTAEYGGYIVSQAHESRKRGGYYCWDGAPEIASGSGVNKDQSVIYPVEVECGSLPCSVFTNGRELTCKVCSK